MRLREATNVRGLRFCNQFSSRLAEMPQVEQEFSMSTKYQLLAAAAMTAALALGACATDGDMQAARAPVAEPVHTASLDDDDADRQICRTNRETGSFVRRTRTCMTEREWQRHYADNTRTLREHNAGIACSTNPCPD
jgi:hypothetical protein